MYGQSHPLFVCLGNWPGFCHSPLHVEIEQPALLSGETWRSSCILIKTMAEMVERGKLTDVRLHSAVFPGAGAISFLIQGWVFLSAFPTTLTVPFIILVPFQRCHHSRAYSNTTSRCCSISIWKKQKVWAENVRSMGSDNMSACAATFLCTVRRSDAACNAVGSRFLQPLLQL